MGTTWFDDIFEQTELWSANDATKLLDSVTTSKFPIPHILIILKNTQSLQKIQEKTNGHQPQTGSDVFIDYVRNHFKEKLQQNQSHLKGGAFEEALEDLMLRQMPSYRNKPLWEERIHNDAQSWRAIDAMLFLDDLENKWNMDVDTIIN